MKFLFTSKAVTIIYIHPVLQSGAWGNVTYWGDQKVWSDPKGQQKFGKTDIVCPFYAQLQNTTFQGLILCDGSFSNLASSRVRHVPITDFGN
jgi:hypothetical protein